MVNWFKGDVLFGFDYMLCFGIYVWGLFECEFEMLMGKIGDRFVFMVEKGVGMKKIELCFVVVIIWVGL